MNITKEQYDSITGKNERKKNHKNVYNNICSVVYTDDMAV